MSERIFPELLGEAGGGPVVTETDRMGGVIIAELAHAGHPVS